MEIKMFTYDICDGDKGIIFAETYDEAVELFTEAYPDEDAEECVDCCASDIPKSSCVYEVVSA